MAETKTVTLRLPLDINSFIEERGNGTQNGIVDCIKKVQYIEKYSMREIKGKLTAKEWMYIADSLNGTLVEGDFRYVPSALIASIEDSDRYDGLASKWEVNVEVLTKKIEQMSCCDIDAIYRRVELFWSNPTDLEEWANY